MIAPTTKQSVTRPSSETPFSITPKVPFQITSQIKKAKAATPTIRPMGTAHSALVMTMLWVSAGESVALVGIDSYNIDDTTDLTRPTHSVLLAKDIPIVEHMCNLGALPLDGFKFFAVPVKVKGMGTFPVRAFAILGD